MCLKIEINDCLLFVKHNESLAVCLFMFLSLCYMYCSEYIKIADNDNDIIGLSLFELRKDEI